MYKNATFIDGNSQYCKDINPSQIHVEIWCTLYQSSSICVCSMCNLVRDNSRAKCKEQPRNYWIKYNKV